MMALILMTQAMSTDFSTTESGFTVEVPDTTCNCACDNSPPEKCEPMPELMEREPGLRAMDFPVIATPARRISFRPGRQPRVPIWKRGRWRSKA